MNECKNCKRSYPHIRHDGLCEECANDNYDYNESAKALAQALDPTITRGQRWLAILAHTQGEERRLTAKLERMKRERIDWLPTWGQREWIAKLDALAAVSEDESIKSIPYHTK